MSVLTYVKSIRFNFNNRYTIGALFSRNYCFKDDKTLEDDTKVPSFATKSTEIRLDNQEDTSTTEREKDATVTSRLSKECNKLAHKKLSLTSSGLNLCLDTYQENQTTWEDFTFDRTIKKLKQQHTLAPVLSATATEAGAASSANRPVRGEPGEVLIGFVPKEWLTFFIPKTGVTGFYTFLVTFGTYLVSKEIYVLEHNFYSGISVFILVWASVKYLGPDLAKYLDKEVDDYEKSWEQGRIDQKTGLDGEIDQEHFVQFQADGQLLLLEAKRQNVALQLEDEFRKRQMQVYAEVKRRLDYHVKVGFVRRRIQQKNLVEYVLKEVKKAVTPEMHDQLIQMSIDRLVGELEKDHSKK